ncbi:MAG: adenosylcobinamide-GDP ribazoletransferase [Alphaproteobacteria bacterium]
MSDSFHESQRARFNLADWAIDLRLALSFLTRLRFSEPTPEAGAAEVESDELRAEHPAPNMARALRAFPLVGIAIGIVSAVIYAVAYHLGVPALAAALCALATSAFVTGALHEDGFADFADGLAGGRSPDDRLRIMDDSRIGAAGALALLFGLGLKAAALMKLGTPGAAAAALVAASAGSRAVFPLIITRLPAVRPGGLGAMVGQPTGDVTVAAVVIGAIAMLLFLGIGQGLVAILVAGLAAAAVAGLAMRSLGGYTGDVLGAVQQVVETAILLAAAAMHGAP